MGETSIQWCDFTFNPWVGCQRVSPGCANCYAEAYDRRVGGRPKAQRKDPEVPELRWGPTAPRVRTSAANWRKPLAWNEAAKKAGERHRVFCASLADAFEDRPELVRWREELFDVIWSTRHLDWLLLTKRPGDIGRLWPKNIRSPDGVSVVPAWEPGPHWPNVWLGTTVEDQQRADERIPELLSVPAAVRFLSCEPLLEQLDLTGFFGGPYVALPGDRIEPNYNAGIDWVIIGGESGPNARPFALDWARDLVRQCRSAGVAPFVKQLGAMAVASENDDRRAIFAMRDPAGANPDEWPEDLRVREFPR